MKFKGLEIDLTALAALVGAIVSGILAIISALKGIEKHRENKPRRNKR